MLGLAEFYFKEFIRMERHGKKVREKNIWEQEQQLVQRQVCIFTSAGSKQAPNKVNINAGLLEDTCHLSLFCAPN